MNKIIRLFIKAIKDPRKIIHFLSWKFKVTESARVWGGGERLVVKNWEKAKNSQDLVILAHIQRYEWVSPLIKNFHVLDAGCGTGYGTHYLANTGAASIIGIDKSFEAINFAKKYRKRKNLEYKVMDVCKTEFRENTFDAIISFEVLEHLSSINQEKFISETRKILKPKGVLYISCPNASLSEGINPYHLKELTKTEFEQLLQKYYKNVKILGQDISIKGRMQKREFVKYFNSKVSLSNFIIVEEDCESSFGLLVICKGSKNFNNNS